MVSFLLVNIDLCSRSILSDPSLPKRQLSQQFEPEPPIPFPNISSVDVLSVQRSGSKL